LKEIDIQEFWQGHPCGDTLVGGLEMYGDDYEAFFTEYDEHRYRTEAHIPKCLDEITWSQRETLEIGLGQGADSEQLIRRGAIWSGIDLTDESVERVRARLELRNLSYCALMTGSVLSLPFDDDSFDVVFSHGVLHHVPDIEKAQCEIHRILKPTGQLVVMLYAKHSLNYLVSICILRRLGLIGLSLLGRNVGGIYGQHLANAREMGLRRYLSMKNFLHRNTDGPLNPYTAIYDKAKVRESFTDFEIERLSKRFMHAPPLPVNWLPLERLLGWHLWVHLRPRTVCR
jgi:SAM-dependent methyltransferase